MKITYIANARLPTEKAHGIQIMKMCEAFAQNGSSVTLVVPRRLQTDKKFRENPFDYYGVQRKFRIKKLPCIDLLGVWPNPVTFYIQAWSFMLAALFYSIFSRETIVFTREEFTASILSRFKKVVYEAHVFPKKAHGWYKRWMPRLNKVITISESLKKLYSSFVDSKKISVAHDGVDLGSFTKLPSKAACRKKVKISSKRVAIYTGHLYKWKGIDTVVEAAKKVKGEIYVVGGTVNDVEKYRDILNKKNIDNMTLVGHVSPQLVPLYLKAADVLLLTSPAKYKISKYYTSPLKLFEYMASKTPILASAVPSSKEVLNEKNSVFFKPDNSADFAKKLNWMFNNTKSCGKKALQSFKDVQKYTWKKRAKNILSFISS